LRSSSKPYEKTRLVAFLHRRVLELRSEKSQGTIAAEAGFLHPNMLAMIKRGTTKLPLDRVIALAAALECDAALLFRMAFEQQIGPGANKTIDRIFGRLITSNEAEWIDELRQASGDTDPRLTTRLRSALRGMFHR
jgi:hypothetical protein